MASAPGRGARGWCRWWLVRRPESKQGEGTSCSSDTSPSGGPGASRCSAGCRLLGACRPGLRNRRGTPPASKVTTATWSTPRGTSKIDWNNFAPTTWTGTAPTVVSEEDRASAGMFKGLRGLSRPPRSDDAFTGGAKQDNKCPNLVIQKADNKADLKRIYLAGKTHQRPHLFLMLAWVRIPQNTTSPSAHIAFEFNKGTTACPGGRSATRQRGRPTPPQQRATSWSSTTSRAVGQTTRRFGYPVGTPGPVRSGATHRRAGAQQ